MKLLMRSLPRENNNMKNHSLWYGYKYYRSTLTDAEKKIYDAIYDGLKTYSSEISVPPISPDKCSKLLDGVSYDIAYLTRFCNIFSVLHKGRILTDALLNELTCINKRKSRKNVGKYTMPQNRKRKFQKGE